MGSTKRAASPPLPRRLRRRGAGKLPQPPLKRGNETSCDETAANAEEEKKKAIRSGRLMPLKLVYDAERRGECVLSAYETYVSRKRRIRNPLSDFPGRLQELKLVNSLKSSIIRRAQKRCALLLKLIRLCKSWKRLVVARRCWRLLRTLLRANKICSYWMRVSQLRCLIRTACNAVDRSEVFDYYLRYHKPICLEVFFPSAHCRRVQIETIALILRVCKTYRVPRFIARRIFMTSVFWAAVEDFNDKELDSYLSFCSWALPIQFYNY